MQMCGYACTITWSIFHCVVSVIAQHHVGVTKITEKALLCDLWSVKASYSYSVAHPKLHLYVKDLPIFSLCIVQYCNNKKIKIIQRDNIIVLLHLHKDLLLFDKRLFWLEINEANNNAHLNWKCKEWYYAKRLSHVECILDLQCYKAYSCARVC